MIYEELYNHSIYIKYIKHIYDTTSWKSLERAVDIQHHLVVVLVAMENFLI